MKGISLKGRLSKKRLFIALAGLVVAGGASGYVLQSGMLWGPHAEGDAAEASGVSCTTTEFIKLNRGGQRWLRKYIRTDSSDGLERVRTALRVAGVLAKAEKADLYQVVVLDNAGPQGRANLRGAAIGAEVLFAPDPTRLPGMEQPFIARYATGKANTIGLFYGERVELSADDIRTAMTSIKDRSDCETVVADASAPEEGEGVPTHGKPGDAHGEAPAEGHGDAQGETPDNGHGEASADAKADASAEGHEASPVSKPDAGMTSGWISTVMSMIPGLGGSTEKTSPEEHQAAAPATENAGILSRVMRMIPGMGADGEATSAPEGTPHEAPSTASADHPAPAAADIPSETPAETAAKPTAEPAAPGHAETAGDPVPSSSADSGHDGTPSQAALPHEAVTVPEQAALPTTDAAEQDAAAPQHVAPEETGATH